MRAKSSNALDWIIRAALVAGGVFLITSSEGPTLLWRNSIVLVPLAALVAVICRWLPCRPVTRHALWFVLLIWLVAGAIVPPVSFESAGSPSEISANNNGILSPASKTNQPATELAVSGDRAGRLPLAQHASAQPAVESAIRTYETRPVDFSVIEDRPTGESDPGAVQEEMAHDPFESPEGDVPSPNPAATIRDADIVACGELNSLPTDQEFTGESFAESIPTPPLTVARTESSEQSGFSPVAESDGQLSLLSADLAGWISTRYGDFRDEVVGWASRRTPNHSEVRMTRIQARRAVESWSPAMAAIQVNQAGPVDDETTAFSDYVADTYASSVSFISARLKVWAAAISGVRDALGRLPAIPVSFWICGIVLVFAARFHRARHFRGLMRTGRVAPSSIRREVRSASKQIGLIEAPITLLVKDQVSPMIWFDGRPTLVLPETLWQELDDAGRKAVLFHELAHLRRRDHWVCRIESLIGAIYWWHPLVWWIRGRLREEAENCCDAWVTWLQPGGRRAYAEALIRTNQFISQPNASVPAGAIGMTSGPARRFARRLTMVMTQTVTPTTSRSTLILALAVLGTGWISTPARSCDPKKDEDTDKALVVAPAVPCTSVIAPISDAPVPPLQSMLISTAPSTDPVAEPVLASMMGTASLLELAPLVTLTLDDREGSGNGRAARDESLEKRLERLEERIARLTEMLEGGHIAVARTPATLSPAMAMPMPPKAGNPVPTSPALVYQDQAAGPGGGVRSRVVAPEGTIYARQYKIPEGRRDGIWELMALPDVPPRVRQIPDGIELQGTREQHAAFSAFVDMICCESGETVQRYRLPENKFKAMTSLMSRSDVPVLIEAGDKEIRVHGTGAVQHIFREFVELIHPRRAAAGPIGVAPTGAATAEPTWLAQVEAGEHAAALEEAMASEHADHAEHSEAKHKHQLVEVDALRKAAQELIQQAAQLESEADRLSDEADEFSDRAAELIEEAESSGIDDQIKAARAESKALVSRARELEKASQKLYAKAAKLDQKGEELEDKADRLNEEMDAAAERGR
ncbi:MAG: hypothetical protein IPK83_15250 [Planctomycetes bacterium]|nr:hypothetical protein [Planctomycetota bacterium]